MIGVAAGGSTQTGDGKNEDTVKGRSAPAMSKTQEAGGDAEGSKKGRSTGCLPGHESRGPDSTPRSERRQRFAALGRDIQALAQELVRKDEKESDEEDETEIRALRGRHSFNFLT